MIEPSINERTKFLYKFISMQTEKIIQSDPCNGITIEPNDNGGKYTCEISSKDAKKDLSFHVELAPPRM